MAQRSRCCLTLPQHVVGLKDMDCTILESSSRGILLESLGKAAVGSHWLGLPVTGYFRVVIRREVLEETYYTFGSHIREATAGPAGRARVRVRQPETFALGQRRKSLRVEPEPQRIQKAYLWRYDRQEGFKLDAPALRRRDFKDGAARLANISAGGLRLTLPVSLAEERGLLLETGHRLVTHFQFIEPRVQGGHEFWMVARINHAATDRRTRELGFGLEFLANGALDAAAGKIRWQPVADNVIPELADIVYHWHLDKYRSQLL